MVDSFTVDILHIVTDAIFDLTELGLYNVIKYLALMVVGIVWISSYNIASSLASYENSAGCQHL